MSTNFGWLCFMQQNGNIISSYEVNDMEKEIAKWIIEIHDIIDFIDDGYHDKDIQTLIKISNELFSKLSPVNQKKCQEWFDKKAKERES